MKTVTYCPFCGKSENVLVQISIKDDESPYKQRMVNGGKYYCGVCRNEYTITYKPLEIV